MNKPSEKDTICGKETDVDHNLRLTNKFFFCQIHLNSKKVMIISILELKPE